MLTGKIVKEFKVGEGFVRIRYPKFEDFEDLQKLINSLIDENTYIGIQKKIGRKGELEFITDLLKTIENKKSVALVSEVNGKV
ncbi:MAG: hypothetical protein KAU95_00595, partial [Candidatus Aenigmarchaeota archaeon]|nr:hypothetical protein [Candidatus Aenigmarchaeota archaeon]